MEFIDFGKFDADANDFTGRYKGPYFNQQGLEIGLETSYIAYLLRQIKTHHALSREAAGHHDYARALLLIDHAEFAYAKIFTVRDKDQEGVEAHHQNMITIRAARQSILARVFDEFEKVVGVDVLGRRYQEIEEAFFDRSPTWDRYMHLVCQEEDEGHTGPLAQSRLNVLERAVKRQLRAVYADPRELVDEADGLDAA